MQPVNSEILERIDAYIERLFVAPDDTLDQNLQDTAAAGLPAINVSPAQGKFLYLLVKMAGAKRALEIGTLGGYSSTWLARALPADGVLVTLELDPKHAAVAKANIARSAPQATVDIRVGSAADILQRMIDAREAAFDVVFIDADKTGYVKYLELSLQLSRPGTVIIADNVIRHGSVLEVVATGRQRARREGFQREACRTPTPRVDRAADRARQDRRRLHLDREVVTDTPRDNLCTP
jgi:predicted O-methyltransferase YrrM